MLAPDVQVFRDGSFDDIADRADDATPAMEAVADMLQDATARRFDRGGDGDWRALSPATLERRRRAGVTSSRILEVSGRLRRSLTHPGGDAIRQIDRDQMIFGTDVRYAPYAARRRPPLPTIDRELAARMSGMVADHIFSS